LLITKLIFYSVYMFDYMKEINDIKVRSYMTIRAF